MSLEKIVLFHWRVGVYVHICVGWGCVGGEMKINKEVGSSYRPKMFKLYPVGNLYWNLCFSFSFFFPLY